MKKNPFSFVLSYSSMQIAILAIFLYAYQNLGSMHIEDIVEIIMQFELCNKKTSDLCISTPSRAQYMGQNTELLCWIFVLL